MVENPSSSNIDNNGDQTGETSDAMMSQATQEIRVAPTIEEVTEPDHEMPIEGATTSRIQGHQIPHTNLLFSL